MTEFSFLGEVSLERLIHRLNRKGNKLNTVIQNIDI